ncbi:MAG: histidinol-phosphate transaminase [Candidatus Marinimicrobia bacterium]|nr:histidinol-phosphate transaminase [Candidatus Neomarinimicrobiota bacterium]MCF7850735.1 histidinol-phosphate transaminase [Candidatus Neomarinimicrobiota bacterium]
MSWIQNLCPPHIQELIPYASAGRETRSGDIWLNANENPLEKKSGGLEKALNRYPQFQPAEILNAYAAYSACPAENLLVTRGIDEGIDLLVRAFCEYRRDLIIYTPPTYGMYSISADAQAIETAALPLTDDFQLDLAAFKGVYSMDLMRGSMSGAYPKLIFLCSPNNPTGNVLDREDIIQVLEMTGGKSIVVIDEAYIEFAPDASFIAEIKNYDNLVVARTLSKAFGLAGLRTGFLAANPEIIAVLQKVSTPYPIPVTSVEIARSALSPIGITAMQDEVNFINGQRESLRSALESFDFIDEIFPSAGNFLLLRVKRAADLLAFLDERGVIIRDRSSQLGLENCVRISMGTETEQAGLIAALKAYGDSL